MRTCTPGCVDSAWQASEPVLIVAEPHDSFAQAALRRPGHRVLVSPSELFQESPFALGIGQDLESWIRLSGRRQSASDMRCVLFRPSPAWTPLRQSSDFDRMFLKHETFAAWCAVLAALRCPVLNRYPPAWWLQMDGYDHGLVRTLRAALGLAASPRQSSFHPGASSSLYFVGSTWLPVDGPAAAFAREVAEPRVGEFRKWQRETGIHLGCLAVRDCGEWTISAVDHAPSFRESQQAADRALDVLDRLAS